MNPPASAGGFFLYARLPLARHRRRSAAHVRRCVYPRRCRGLTEGVTARAVGLRLWSSGVPPARRQQGRVKSRHAALRSAYRVMAECRRSATMGADVCGDALLRERGGDGPQRGRDDRCATTGETGWSAGRTRFQLTPDSASGDRVEMERCTAGRCRCRCIAGVCQRRCSAAHVRLCVYPRRCRGLTEDETARAV